MGLNIIYDCTASHALVVHSTYSTHIFKAQNGGMITLGLFSVDVCY